MTGERCPTCDARPCLCAKESLVDAAAKAMMDHDLWPGAFDGSVNYGGQSQECDVWRERARVGLGRALLAYEHEVTRLRSLVMEAVGEIEAGYPDSARNIMLSKVGAPVLVDLPCDTYSCSDRLWCVQRRLCKRVIASNA